MPGPPNMVVRFYKNFREVEVDIHFAGVGGITGGTETRTYAVHEVIEEDVGEIPGDPEHRHEFEVVEVRDYTESGSASFTRILPHVNASGGTWTLELDKFTSSESPIISSPVSHLFDAAALRAAISTEDIGTDPGTLHLFRRSVRTGSGDSPVEVEPGDGTFAKFIDRPDLGPNTVEVRFFFSSGKTGPRHEAGVQTHDIDLGPIIERRPEWDEVTYSVPLEFNPQCSPSGGSGIPIDVPEGLARAEGARSGRVVRRGVVGGSRSG